MKTNVPNLDATDVAQLRAFYRTYWRCDGDTAAELFPTRPDMYIRVTMKLACYANNKATAMEQRATGYIQTALVCESICERIYSELPDWAKW